MIHNNIDNEIIIIGITEEYEEPFYMDKARNVYSEKDAFSFEPTYKYKTF